MPTHINTAKPSRTLFVLIAIIFQFAIRAGAQAAVCPKGSPSPLLISSPSTRPTTHDVGPTPATDQPPVENHTH